MGRVGAATGGAVAVESILIGVVAWSPWRPTGLVTALVLLGLAAPLAAAAGVALVMRAAGQVDGGAARLAALGTPPIALLALFTFDVVAPDTGVVQAAALLAGAAMAAALAARLTDPALQDD